MPIRACPTCGSDRLVFPKATAGSAFTCDDCGWSGAPKEFPNWSAWQEFRLAQKVVA